MRVGVCVCARAVVVVRVAIDGLRPGRHRAAVGGEAGGDLKLDGGVVDAEMIAQLMVEALEHGLALDQRHLGDLHMAGEGVVL